MTQDELARRKPPYVIAKRSGYYWQPKGKIRLSSPPCELGTEQIAAYIKGWELYYAAKRDRATPSAAMQPYSVSWAADKWRQSDDFKLLSNGEPKAKGTIRYYNTGLRVIEARIGKRDLRVLQRPHVKKWRKELYAEGKPHQAALVLKTLRAFYSFCRDEGWYRGRNPAGQMKIFVPKKKGYVPWTWERVKTFYKASVERGRRSVGLAVALTYDTAQNPIDILRLEWPSEEEQQGVVLLYDDNIPRYKEGEVDMSRLKTGVGGITPLSIWCKSLIEATPEQQRHGHVIRNEETGEPYTKRIFNKWVAEIRRDAGLPDELKAGNLRHEAGQEADDGGASSEEIQGLLKHSEPGTQKYYTKRRRADKAQAARERLRKERAQNRSQKV